MSGGSSSPGTMHSVQLPVFLEKLLDGADMQSVPLEQVGEVIRGNGLQKKELTEAGFPAIHYGQLYTRFDLFAERSFSFTSVQLAKKLKKARCDDLLIATTSENDEEVLKPLAWHGGEVAISGDMMLFRHKQNVRYLAYCFLTQEFQKRKIRYITGAKVRRISKDNLRKLEVPIPCPDNPEKSLAIQAEIVRILDTFTELTADLTAELTARKKQYNYYRDQLLSFEAGDVEWKALGAIGEPRMCKRILKNQTSPEGEIPFYKIGTFGKKPDSYISRVIFEDYKKRYHYPKVGEILLSASGTIGRAVIFDGESAYFQDSNIVWIENDENLVLNKYLFYFYQIISWHVADGGVIKRLYNDNIRKSVICVPYPNDPKRSLAEQARIVSILDKFDTLAHSINEGLPREIELRQKQYEYYRDLLLSFPKPAAQIETVA